MDGRDCERKNMLTFHTQQFLYMFSLQKKLQVRADKHLAGSGCGRFENLDPDKIRSGYTTLVRNPVIIFVMGGLKSTFLV